MTILSICITGEPVLHGRAQPVTDFSPSLNTLADDMLETMDEAPGVGLAAPQVGLGLRMFVYGWEDNIGTNHRGVAVNPELWITPTTTGPLLNSEEEGCLSVPGERFPVRRADRAILKAYDVKNEPFTVEADGWLARIFQHEFDHLNGTLYTDRLEPAYAKSVAKVIRKSGWGRPGITWTPGVDDIDA